MSPEQGDTGLWARFCLWFFRKSPKVYAAVIDPNIIVCRGCGDHFHRSWGRYCPNCTGAD